MGLCRAHPYDHVRSKHQGERSYVLFLARARPAGHILWIQTEPSFTWLPFFLMRSLHLGQVPISLSLDHFLAERRRGPYYTRRGRACDRRLRVLPSRRPGKPGRHRLRGRRDPGLQGYLPEGTRSPPHRSEEHTSELQSRPHLVCRLLLEKKKKKNQHSHRQKNKESNTEQTKEQKNI